MQTAEIKATVKTISDQEIIRRVLSGDLEAFELLMRRYNRPLYRTARSILKDDTEAEDVLQDAYLLAYQGIGKFRGDSTLSTWLTRIVVNEAIARTRKSARRGKILQFGAEWQSESDEDEAKMSQATIEQPDQAAMRAEVRRLIEKKIDDLPDAFRTVFVLRALEEMSVEEVAACLDIPEATVRTRFFRAKSLLREALSREIDFASEEAFSFDGARCDRIVAGVLARLSTSAGNA